MIAAYHFAIPGTTTIIVDLDLTLDKMLAVYDDHPWLKDCIVYFGHLLKPTTFNNEHIIYWVTADGRYEINVIKYVIGWELGKEWINERIKSAKTYQKVDITL